MIKNKVARAFTPDKPLQDSLIFVSKDGVCQSGPPLRNSTLGWAPDLEMTRKTCQRQNALAYFHLHWRQKRFNIFDNWSKCYKTFYDRNKYVIMFVLG
jgi:hypothetical protein